MSDDQWKAFLETQLDHARRVLSRLVREHREYGGKRDAVNPDWLSERQWYDVRAQAEQVMVLEKLLAAA